LASLVIGSLAAWLIGFGVSRPIRSMARGMRELAAGNLEADVRVSERHDEIQEMADAVQVFRASMIRVQELADGQERAAEDVRAARDALETLNRELEAKVEERTSELAGAREAAEAANRAKSTFLANMSHELRTPMNAILGYSEMMMEEAADAGQEGFVSDLQKIHQSGSHLLSLINDVLDLAKVESGKMEAVAEEFAVATVIEEVGVTAEPLMSKNGNRLQVEPAASLGMARQDLTKLRQALLNLLSNAAKFTHEGTVVLRAARSSHDGVDWLTFSVRDSGIGIPADKIGRVFEEFGQADDTTTRDYGGTGLGLPISRRFCQMLGGDLTVESQPGAGSTFTIRVPAVLPGAAPAEQVVAEPARADVPIAELRRPGAGRTVLVIDDDPDARQLVSRLLAKDDLEVVVAASGEEGIRLAHSLAPAVITLDVMMPEMDGWAVLRALKADPEVRDIPVVMLTMLDEEAKAYSLGATDYLVKPVERDALRSVISGYTEEEAPARALLIDDDPVVRETVGRALADASWEVTEAENGRIALDRLSSARPTLILLDLMMPVMDGFDFLLELHARPEWRDVPVVVLTSKDLTEEDRRMLSGRVEQLYEKNPMSHDQLVGLVHRLAHGQHGTA
jgi:signal transduction histidine kinase/DNA-binding response OmpR family regulator